MRSRTKTAGQSVRTRARRSGEVAGTPSTRDKEAAYQALTDEILSGVLAPGTPLPERALVKRFGISRTPIRQVLWMLERDGLVEVHPKRGAFVKKLGARDIGELFQLREALEPLAASLAASNRPSAEVEELREALLAAAADPSRDAKELVKLGAQLHDAIARWSGNRMLQHIYETLRLQTHLLRNLLHEAQGSERASLEEHIGIIGAIAEGDAVDASRRMADHLRRARMAIIEELFTPRPLAPVEGTGAQR